MTNILSLKKKWLSNTAFKKAYEDAAPEFEISRNFIKARMKAGLTQEELAKRMGTTQSVIARLESGRIMPSMKTILRYAYATGTKLAIKFI